MRLILKKEISNTPLHKTYEYLHMHNAYPNQTYICKKKTLNISKNTKISQVPSSISTGSGLAGFDSGVGSISPGFNFLGSFSSSPVFPCA